MQVAEYIGRSQSAALPLSAPKVVRVRALDWTKGALVICMVIYHSINYSAFRPFGFRFLPFLPPSFILVAGFIVGQVYASKYSLSSWEPYRRLFVRGIKLLLLFTALNLARCIFIERNVVDGALEFADRANVIFLSGNGRTGIFEVLLPIAYFLLLAPALLWLRSRVSASITIGAAAVFLVSFILQMNGKSFKNLDLISAGLIGMAFGSIKLEAINRFASRLPFVIGLYLGYRLLSYLLDEICPVQIMGDLTTLLLLYSCALHLKLTNWTAKQVILLGQCSLLGYLAQIAVLQGIIKLVGGRPATIAPVVIVGLTTALLTLGIVRSVHAIRRKSPRVDWAYKAVLA